MKIATPPDLCFEVFHLSSPMSDYDSWGAYYSDSNVLWVNMRVHTTKMFLEYTIVHELVHCKNMRLKHGEKFNKIVDSYFQT